MEKRLWWLLHAKRDSGLHEDDSDEPCVLNWTSSSGQRTYPLFTDQQAAIRARQECDPNGDSHEVEIEDVPPMLAAYFIKKQADGLFVLDPASMRGYKPLKAGEMLTALQTAGYTFEVPD